MKRSIAIAVLALVLALPLSVAAQSSDSSAPAGVIVGNQVADLYPIAFGNVLGLDSTLFLSSIEGGNFEVVSRGTDGQVNSFPMEVEAGTVEQIPMQDIGIADGTGMIVVRAADARSVGFSVLAVQTQAGGVDIVEPMQSSPRALEGGPGAFPRVGDDDFDDDFDDRFDD